MNNKNLFSLTLITLLGLSMAANAVPNGYGIIVPSPTEHQPGCCDAPFQPTGCIPCADIIPGVGLMVSIWADPGMILATGLDLAATKKQQKKSVDAEKALQQLEQNLGGGCSGSKSQGEDTSLVNQDTVPVVPFDAVVIENGSFDEVRQAINDFIFYSNDCQNDCVVERQNTWLLTSLALAAATGDRLLAASKDEKPDGQTLTSEFEALATNFNGQTSPMQLWGASSQITLHTHIQQNDINALYARDLEMNALNGVHESEDTKIIQ